MNNHIFLSNMTTHRPSATPPPPPTTQNNDESHRKNHYTLTFSFPFEFPPSAELAALIKNLERFGLYYSTFIWTVLFISLVPERKVSVIYLVAMTEVTFLYFLLLRALPDSEILHRIINKRLVLFFLFVVTSFLLILTDAAAHLFIVLAATLPIVVIHAALMKTEEGLFVQEVGEMARLVQEKLGEAQPESLV